MEILAAGLLGILVLAGLVSLVCHIIILIDAFNDEIWKGILCLLCGLYGVYYALAEFEHEKKWLIIAGAAAPFIVAWPISMFGAFAS